MDAGNSQNTSHLFEGKQLSASDSRILNADITESALFNGVDINEITEQLSNCTIWRVDTDDYVMQAGTENNQVYLLLSGTLAVILAEDGTEPVTIYLHPGESVGEISVVDGRPVSADVIAKEPATLLRIEGPVFWSLVKTSTQFARNIMAMLAFRIRSGNITIADSVKRQREYRYRATVDTLTNLRNRSWFDDALVRQLKLAESRQQPICLLMLDVDNFKSVNDRYGHVVGDHVLATVGAILNSSIRPSDLSARYGGEEFTIILPDTPLSTAKQIAERLRQQMESRNINIDNSPDEVSITISLGIAMAKSGEHARMLVDRADRAMYKAKEMGKNAIAEVTD